MSAVPSPSGSSDRPIIIKKVKKGGEHGHHGGAWKVAYADFVTAMMAFFLLLWLLQVTTSEQRQGIADYFEPASISRSTSGSGGLLGGLTVGQPGAQSSPSAQISLEQAMPGRPEPLADGRRLDSGDIDEPTDNPAEDRFALRGVAENLQGDQVASADATELEGDLGPAPGNSGNQDGSGSLSEQQLRAAQAAAERQAFSEAAQDLRQAIQAAPELENLENSIVVDQTPEGLRIQIVDQDQYSMFPAGRAQPYAQTQQLLALIAQAVGQLPNQISISGHTDSTPFVGGTYDNWELSADRANAARRALVGGGLDPSRIANVVGKADTDHLLTDDPNNPRNRRIAITLLRNPGGTAVPGQEAAAAAPSAPTGG